MLIPYLTTVPKPFRKIKPPNEQDHPHFLVITKEPKTLPRIKQNLPIPKQEARTETHPPANKLNLTKSVKINLNNPKKCSKNKITAIRRLNQPNLTQQAQPTPDPIIVLAKNAIDLITQGFTHAKGA